MNTRWLKSIFTLELRQIITYRADFWINFLGNISINFVLAYFLWKSIYTAKAVESMNGFSMNDIILYYIVAPQLFKIQQGSGIGNISREIYEGGLTKYILYPIDYYLYKIVVYLAHSTFYILQLFMVLFLYWVVLGQDHVLNFTPLQFLCFIFSLYFIALLYFAMSSTCELIAFWADNIWSLGVILRFSVSFLGGALIPLSFFPTWAQTLLYKTPFPYLITFPMNTLMKEFHFSEYLSNLGIIILWCIAFLLLSKLVWIKGKYKYTGVGI
tara:strand:+ start:42283 stop:43092 length:810 start_codon:yes stop_codon:yes gene_type:complete